MVPSTAGLTRKNGAAMTVKSGFQPRCRPIGASRNSRRAKWLCQASSVMVRTVMPYCGSAPRRESTTKSSRPCR